MPSTASPPNPHQAPPVQQLRAAMQANRLLAVMPPDALERLMPHMAIVKLAPGETLYNGDLVLEHVYFPLDLIVTLLLQLGGHTPTKLAMVGCEGVVGISAYMGGGRPQGSAVVLNKGEAIKLPAAVLKTEFDLNGATMRLLLRFTQALVTQMAQTAVCNRHHVVEQQLSAWLLTCMDRLPPGTNRPEGPLKRRPDRRPDNTPSDFPNSLQITQATVAEILGVRREAISDAAGKLRDLGLIAFRRGRISLLDRPGLQARACECYQVVKRETSRLLPDRPAT